MTSAFHVYFGPRALAATPRVRRIGPEDCFSALLKEGVEDFFAMPTYPVFVGLFYAVAGIALFAMTSFGNALHLAFPLAAGFALVGPFVAIGLYEMSRRRERGLPRQRARRLHGASLAGAAVNSRVRPAAAYDLRRLDLRRRAHLCPDLRAEPARLRHLVLSRRPDDGSRGDVDCRRHASRLLLRRACARDQRRLIPAHARSRPRPCAGARGFVARDARQSGCRRACGV